MSAGADIERGVSVTSPSRATNVSCFSLHPDEDPLQPVTSDETVSAGGTVTLTCRVADNDNSSLQWSNTAQQTLYFGDKRGETKHTGEAS